MHRALVAAALLLAGCASPIGPDAPDGSRDGTGTGGETNTNSPWREGHLAGCSGTGHVQFTTAPMRAEDYLNIQPYGLMVGAHVTPIDHMYFAPPHGSARDAFEVRAIADGVIHEIQPRDVNVDTGQAKLREWRMDIAHTCDFASYFDLITSLEPWLQKAYDEQRATPGRPWSGIPVKAGQVVGRIGAQTLDFGVYDYTVTLPGFIVPSHYEREPWKVHTVDPFPHFAEPVRSELLAKNLRRAEPRAGKIDYDVDGRMVGNWFLQGTNGYAGLDPMRGWEGHLALAYDFLEPAQLRFSIGDWSGGERQFGVAGNAPDWSTLSTASGTVKVELQHYEHYDRASGRTGFHAGGIQPGDDVAARNFGPVQGIALLQLVEDRILKAESFPEQTADQVNGFTPAAKLYER